MAPVAYIGPHPRDAPCRADSSRATHARGASRNSTGRAMVDAGKMGTKSGPPEASVQVEWGNRRRDRST